MLAAAAVRSDRIEKRGTMSKIKLLKIVNSVLGISFILQVISTVAGLYTLHKINGMIFIIIAIVHVALNWGWIKANFIESTKNTNR